MSRSFSGGEGGGVSFEAVPNTGEVFDMSSGASYEAMEAMMEAATLSALRFVLRSMVSVFMGLRSGELGRETEDEKLVPPVEVVEGGGEGRLPKPPMVDPLSLLFEPWSSLPQPHGHIVMSEAAGLNALGFLSRSL